MRFQITRPVQIDDIDEMGHVNNTVYLRWVQDAAVAHWKAVASAEARASTVWVVLRHEIDYKMPALLGDEVLVETWVGVATRLTFERYTEMFRAADRQLFARARTVWCPVSTKTGRPKRVDEAVRRQFSVPEPDIPE